MTYRPVQLFRDSGRSTFFSLNAAFQDRRLQVFQALGVFDLFKRPSRQRFGLGLAGAVTDLLNQHDLQQAEEQIAEEQAGAEQDAADDDARSEA